MIFTIRLFACLMLVLALCATSAHAQTGTKKTPTALNAEINIFYADNNVGAITPSVARQVTLDQNASVPFLLTTNIFSAYQAINLNGVSLPAPQSGTLLQGSAPATFAGRFEIDSFGASSHFSGVRANGTVGSPTTLINGSEIVSLNAFGYNGLANVGPFAAFRCFADQTWTSGSAAGTYCDIATTPDNSTTMASIVKFNNDGGVVFGAATGGDKGSGTLNAVGLYINGVAAGNVSSVSNSDSTLTISPTTGPVVASLNLAHANTWTGNITVSNAAIAAITVANSTSGGNAYLVSQNSTRGWLLGAAGDGVACVSGTIFVFYDATSTACRGYIGSTGGWSIGLPTGGDEGSGTLNLAGGALYNNGTAPTGTGAYVRATSPTLVTPTLGVALATSLQFSPSTGGIIGTPTNNNASGGVVGEYISSSVASGSAVALTTGTAANITSISLTAGDWDVSGEVNFIGGATTTVGIFAGSISTTTATMALPPSGGYYASTMFNNVGLSTFNPTCPLSNIRLSLSGTTTVFLVGFMNFATSTASAFGFIGARRIR